MSDLLTKLDEFIKSAVANPYFGLIGFLVGLAGLLFSFYIAKRDRRIKELKCGLVSTNIISKSETLFPKLLIKYDNQELENLTITKISIKNTGTDVLKLDDVAEADPITFSTELAKGVRLLDFGITYVDDELNKFKVERTGENTIRVGFDYIEPKDFVIIQVLHTGKDSNDIKVTGTVIGAKKPFIPNETTETTVEKSRIVRAFRSASPRLVTLIFLFSWIMACGLISYSTYTLTTNLIIGSICILPALLPIWLLATILFRKPDKDREMLSKEMVASMFGRAFNNMYEKNDNKNV